MTVGATRLTGLPVILSIEQLLRRMCEVAVYLAIGVLAIMMVLVAGQVVVRNVFNLGLPWADELARFTGLWLVYLTVPHLLLDGKHISVDLVVAQFSRRAQILAQFLSELCVIAFCAFVLASLDFFLQRAAKFVTPAVQMPNWLFYMPMIVGFVLLTLIALYRILRQLRLGLSGEPEPRG